MRRNTQKFIYGKALENTVHLAGVTLGGMGGYVQNLVASYARSKLDIQLIPRFNHGTGLCYPAVYGDPSLTAHLVGHSPSLDYPGYLQELVHSHLITPKKQKPGYLVEEPRSSQKIIVQSL